MTADSATKSKPSEKFALCFDEPADWTARVRSLRLSGWCVAVNGEPLTAIQVRLGGKTFPGSFDRERPDVAEHLKMPTAPLRCGFSVDLKVPPGKGDLELQVAGADGRWRKAFARTIYGPWFSTGAERDRRAEIDLVNAKTYFDFCFDRPVDWDKPTSTLYISGWCVDRGGASIVGIRGRIGSKIFLGNFGMARKDVAALYPTFATARNAGFAVAVPLPVGKSVMLLELQNPNGSWRALFRHEVQGVLGGEIIAPEEAVQFLPNSHFPRVQFWFDRPVSWTNRVRHLRISGWCLAIWGEDLTELRARVRGKIFKAHYGILRPDVAASFESGVGALRSGFALDVVVPLGRSTLVLESRSSGGEWEPFFSSTVRGPLLWSQRSGDEEEVGNYAEWMRLYDRVSRDDLKRIQSQIVAFARRPTISVLVPAYNTNLKWLRRAIASVRKQLYENWELCIVDDASTDPGVWKLLQAEARRDARIKIFRRPKNGHISAASNDALGMATGEFIALLDHDDELAPTALYFAALEINRDPQLRLLYSDEDKLDKQGRRCDPYFKTDWNPDLLASQNYVSHLSIYAADLVRKVGGFREGFEGSQDYDLIWRCAEQIEPSQIRHIPHVLYHWRIVDESTATFAAAKPYAHEAAIRAVQEHFDRRGIAAQVVSHYANYLRAIYVPPSEQPLVSIIIPTRDRVTLLRQCIESIFANTAYPNFEILVIDNASREPETAAYFESLEKSGRARVLRAGGEFNYSRLNNLGVDQARGVFVALLNNDLEVINREWLTEMASHAARPEIGAVGARLWYPDGTLQHGGVILGVGGVGTHAHHGIRKEHGYFARAHLTQNFSAVTAACMVLRKAVYQEMDGLDETNLAVAFNDVDFCLRLRERGLRIVWTPHAELRHHESASRGLEDTGTKQRRFLAEVAFMQKKWGQALETDPFYNPNLSIESNRQFKLAFPPRVQKPWTENPL